MASTSTPSTVIRTDGLTIGPLVIGLWRLFPVYVPL